MPVFTGSAWQIGHGQMGHGLGGLFRGVAKAVMPFITKKPFGKQGWHFIGISHIIMVSVLVENDLLPTRVRAFIDNTA